jgi:hypothetical protein
MKDPKYNRMYADLLKSRKSIRRKSQFDNIRKEKRYDPLALQLPTVIVAGAKKCGTKALMRFFGHHPQILSGYGEDRDKNEIK